VNVSDALLRHHREAVRWTVEEATAELGATRRRPPGSRPGTAGPVPGDMLKLLTAYGVSHRERQDIAALTQGVRAGWWGDPDGKDSLNCTR
jgi:hypothetical protein